MKIIIDIGHPAHVHYFKNFIRIMEENDHDFIIVSRDKEITFYLLDKLGISYISRGKGGNGILSKVLYIPKADWFIYKIAKKYKPDLFLSFGSTYAAHTSRMFGKPHIALDDTEHAIFEHLLYPPFTDVILNPSCFSKRIGRKQVFFNSYVELLYLHQNYFKPNKSVLDLLGVSINEEYAIVRFVSWNASHDVNEKGLSNDDKVSIVSKLSKKMKVFVSSEGEVPPEIKQFEYKIPFELMHDSLYFARIYVGEGGTTASESAILGTPAVYINNLSMGYIEDEKQAGLLIQTTVMEEIEKAIEYFIAKGSYLDYRQLAKLFIRDKIDPTAFLIWFIENYPQSAKIMKKNPDYQYRFK